MNRVRGEGGRFFTDEEEQQNALLREIKQEKADNLLEHATEVDVLIFLKFKQLSIRELYK